MIVAVLICVRMCYSPIDLW